MSRRRTAVIVTAAVAAVVLAVGLPLFQPWRVFTDTVVDESLPIATTGTDATTAPATPGSEGPSTMSTPSSSTAAPTVSARQPQTLARGRFVSHEHGTAGTVAVLRLPDDSRVLRIEGLDTSDGPDLHVWLSDAAVREGVKGWRVFDDGRYHDLGKLKGNKGNQNYVLPASLELGDYRSVSIWCDRFNVSFGAATLETASG